MNVRIVLVEKAAEMVAQKSTVQLDGETMDTRYYSWAAPDSGQPLLTNLEFQVRKGVNVSVEAVITYLDPATGQEVDYAGSGSFLSDRELVEVVVTPVPLSPTM